MNGWAVRAKGGSGGCWAEVGRSSRGAYVNVTVGGKDGYGLGRARITAEGARLLRRALSRAIRELESGDRSEDA